MKIVASLSLAFVVLVGAVALTAGGSVDDAMPGLGASDFPSEADCEFLDRVELDLLDPLYSPDLRKRLDDLRRDLRRDLRDRCDAASETENYAP
mgnify:CR=1 FL=1